MSASLNSEAGGSVGVQSTPDRQAPVSGQEQSRFRRRMWSRTRKQTTNQSLTAGHHGMAQQLKKAKTRKSRGVKASGSGGSKPGLVPGAGRGRGAIRLLPVAAPKLESVQLPTDTSESSDTDEESDGGVQSPSHSSKESKSDQFALPQVTLPQGLSTPGGITTTVTDNPVLTQDSSPVLNSS